MDLRTWAAAAACLTFLAGTAPASADLVPSGAKRAQNSVLVEGDAAPDWVLILANTFYGARRLTPGTPSPVTWHPLHGDMRLVMVPAAIGAKIPDVEPQPDERKHAVPREELLKLADKHGIPCGEAFSGTRILPAREPAYEVRLVLRVEATATTCTATPIRTEYYAKDGRPVGGPGEPQPGATSSAPSASASASATPTPPSASASASAAEAPPLSPGAAPPAGCGACAAAREDATWAGPLAVWLLVAARAARRRRTRPRRSRTCPTPTPGRVPRGTATAA